MLKQVRDKVLDVRAMRALWASDGASFDGEFASFSRVSSNPKPAQGAVPIVIGGHSRAAAERAVSPAETSADPPPRRSTWTRPSLTDTDVPAPETPTPNFVPFTTTAR